MHNTFKVNTIIYYHLFFSFLYKVAKNLKSTNENFTSTINKKKSGKPSWLGLKIDITEVRAPFLIHLRVQNGTNQCSSILGNPKIPNCTFICTLQRLGRSHLQTVLLHHKPTDTTPQQQNPNTQQKTQLCCAHRLLLLPKAWLCLGKGRRSKLTGKKTEIQSAINASVIWSKGEDPDEENEKWG